MSDTNMTRRKRARAQSQKNYFHRFIAHSRNAGMRKIVLGFFSFLLVLGILGFLLVYVIFLRDAPSIDDITTSFKESSIIYDREGTPLYTIYGGGENRQYVTYDQISENVINAVVAMEDQTFFSNPGFDVVGIIRSMYDCATNRTGLCGG